MHTCRAGDAAQPASPGYKLLYSRTVPLGGGQVVERTCRGAGTGHLLCGLVLLSAPSTEQETEAFTQRPGARVGIQAHPASQTKL